MCLAELQTLLLYYFPGMFRGQEKGGHDGVPPGVCTSSVRGEMSEPSTTLQQLERRTGRAREIRGLSHQWQRQTRREEDTGKHKSSLDWKEEGESANC